MHSGATKINSANMQVGGKQVLSHDKYTGIQGYLHKRKKEKERERERERERDKFTCLT
jgi:uncharacterized heparinase superfamily protein